MSGVILLMSWVLVGCTAAAQADQKDALRKPRLHFKEIRGPAGRAYEVVFSHDGTKMAVGAGANITVWNIADGKEFVRMQLPQYVTWHYVVFAADDKTIIWSGTEDPMIRVFDPKTGRQIHEFLPPPSLQFFSPDGLHMACRGKPTGMDIFEIATRKKVMHIGEKKNNGHASFSLDGKKFIFSNFEDGIRFYDVFSGKLLKVIKHKSDFKGVGLGWAFCSPDGNMVAAMDHPSAIQILDVRTGKRVDTIPTAAPCHLASFTRDNKSLLYLDQGEVILYSLVEKVIHRLNTPNNIQFVTFTPNEKKLVFLTTRNDREGKWTYSFFVRDLPAGLLNPADAPTDEVPREKQ